MSRLGRKPISLSSDVKVDVSESVVKVTGPKGNLSLDLRDDFAVEVSDNQLTVLNHSKQKDASAFYGLYRSLLNNMVIGVTEGYEKKLELFGVGYRAQKKGQDIELSIGFSHPVLVKTIEGITLDIENQTTISISGIDKQAVGEVAANIIKIRDAKKDPYKNKGVRYVGAVLRKKTGKRIG